MVPHSVFPQTLENLTFYHVTLAHLMSPFSFQCWLPKLEKDICLFLRFLGSSPRESDSVCLEQESSDENYTHTQRKLTDIGRELPATNVWKKNFKYCINIRAKTKQVDAET